MSRKISIFFVLLFAVVPCYADDMFWVGGGEDNLWSNPDNWDPRTAPTERDNISIPGPYTISHERFGTVQVGWYDTASSTYQSREMAISGGATLDLSDYGNLFTRSGKITVNQATIKADELHVGDSGPGEFLLSSGNVKVNMYTNIANIGPPLRDIEMPPQPSFFPFNLTPEGAVKVPESYAYGILTQTGGTLETNGLLFSNTRDHSLNPTPNMHTGAEYNLSGGTLIAGTVRGSSSYSHYYKTIVPGETNIQVSDEFTATRVKSKDANNDPYEQYVRIFGARANVDVGTFNARVRNRGNDRIIDYGNLDSHFYLASHGVSLIDAARYASVDQDHIVGVWGFAALTEKRYDLIRAVNEIIDPGTWSIRDQTGVGFKAATDIKNGWHNAYIYIDEENPPAKLDTWRWTEKTRYNIVDESLWQQGALKVDGWRWEAVTMYLDPNSLSDGLAEKLVAFLNDREDGLRYYLLEDQTSVGFLGHLLNASGEGYFAWDMSWFNEVNKSGAGVIAYEIGYFHTPESAAWRRHGGLHGSAETPPQRGIT